MMYLGMSMEFVRHIGSYWYFTEMVSQCKLGNFNMDVVMFTHVQVSDSSELELWLSDLGGSKR